MSYKYPDGQPRLNDIIQVTFQDHVEDSDETIRCVVYGKLVKKNNSTLTVECWTCTDPVVNEDNNKRFSIVRRAIEFVEILLDGD